MSVAAWTTELNKVANDTLRTTGDVPGIQTKYEELQGVPDWVNITTTAFLGVVGEDYIKNLTAQELDDFQTRWTTVAGDIRLNDDVRRAEIFLTLTVQQQTDLQGIATNQDELWETIAGLSRPTTKRLIKTLKGMPDSPQGLHQLRKNVLDSIEQKTADFTWRTTTSLANLQTIDSLLGV